MSTISCIIIKLRKDDIGKEIKFDKDKLPKGVSLAEWKDKCVDESSPEQSESVKLEHPYIGVYCHFDGYPDSVGQVLKDIYPDYDDALNLIVGGSISYIDEHEAKHYANRKNEKWEYNAPLQGDEPKDIYRHMDWTEYCYVLDENGWQVNDYSHGEDKDDAGEYHRSVFEEY